MRNKYFVLSVLVVVFVTSACTGCGHESNPRDYQLDYYIDTLQGHVIISAVCSKKDGIGISSIDVGPVTQHE